mmetsp:Transcript_11562/g.39753  ORF Transcript_11562/g.39753 Transcript_11562/m.39753 type:complete len:199 (+) Transcript_11562:125-721(+)
MGEPQNGHISVKVSKEKLERQVMAYDYALKQLDEEAATIEDGTHPELVARVKVLDDTRDARIARATRDYEAELATLDRLHDHEIEVSGREMRRRLDAAEEKIVDQLASAKARAEGIEDPTRVHATRNLRSRDAKDDERGPRRGAARTRGPQTPATLLLDQGLTEAEMLDDFVAIASAVQAQGEPVANGGTKRKKDEAE